MDLKSETTKISKLRRKNPFDLSTPDGQGRNTELAWKKNYIKNAYEKIIFQMIQSYAAVGKNVCCQPHYVLAKEAKCSQTYISKIVKRLAGVLVDGNPLVKIYHRRYQDRGFAPNLLVPLNISTGEYASFDLELINALKKTPNWKKRRLKKAK